MAQWEYMNVVIVSTRLHSQALDAQMTRLGDAGWEMCGVGSYIKDLSGYRVFFKRPKQNATPYRD